MKTCHQLRKQPAYVRDSKPNLIVAAECILLFWTFVRFVTIHTLLPPHPSSSLPPQNRSACPPSKLILIRIPQNRQEVRFCAELSLACGLCDAKVERWGHPPNFVRPSIEEEHKFGGWICQRRVASSAVAATQRGRS
eukprot:COSAG02_NODE_1689_length_11307_cov_50.624911_3_plen_137_part_00